MLVHIKKIAVVNYFRKVFYTKFHFLVFTLLKEQGSTSVTLTTQAWALAAPPGLVTWWPPSAPRCKAAPCTVTVHSTAPVTHRQKCPAELNRPVWTEPWKAKGLNAKSTRSRRWEIPVEIANYNGKKENNQK